jgi:hypothetical protein
MADLPDKISNTFGAMNEAERRAYSLGISHAYADVFTMLMQVAQDGEGLSVARARLQGRWADIVDIQKARGIL